MTPYAFFARIYRAITPARWRRKPLDDGRRAQLRLAHTQCTNNRAAIEETKRCACFSCMKRFNTLSVPITEWTDHGDTAICPFCKVDAIIPVVNVPAMDDDKFMQDMNRYWFWV